MATGEEATKLFAALEHILNRRVVLTGTVVRRVVEILLQLFIRDRDVQVVAEALERFHSELLDLVG